MHHRPGHAFEIGLAVGVVDVDALAALEHQRAGVADRRLVGVGVDQGLDRTGLQIGERGMARAPWIARAMAGKAGCKSNRKFKSVDANWRCNNAARGARPTLLRRAAGIVIFARVARVIGDRAGMALGVARIARSGHDIRSVHQPFLGRRRDRARAGRGFRESQHHLLDGAARHPDGHRAITRRSCRRSRTRARCCCCFPSAANKSAHVLREVELAEQGRKPIFPLRIDVSDPAGGLKYMLANKQWVERKALGNRLVDTIEQLLAGARPIRTGVDEARARPAPEPPKKKSAVSPALIAAIAIVLLLGGGIAAWQGDWFGIEARRIAALKKQEEEDKRQAALRAEELKKQEELRKQKEEDEKRQQAAKGRGRKKTAAGRSKTKKKKNGRPKRTKKKGKGRLRSSPPAFRSGLPRTSQFRRPRRPSAMPYRARRFSRSATSAPSCRSCPPAAT